MKRHVTLLSILLTLVIPKATFAQNQRPWEIYFSTLATADDIDSEQWQDTYEMLCDLEQHPIDINTATREQLLQLPFLNEHQVEDIQAYIYYNREMKTTGELAMIESIDYTTRCLLTHFIYCGEKQTPATPNLKNILKYGKNDLTATASIPFYKRKGDKEGYLGYQYAHSIRYNFTYSNQLRIGVLGTQDAGEPFFANRNSMGYDHYSFYAEAHRMGRLKSAVVGRFRASFGMGLVMGDGYNTGKMTTLAALGNSRAYGLKTHTTRSAGNSLQGAGATITIAKGLDVSGFASYRKADATLADSGATISTILTNNYHRTQTEMDKKNNISETTAGANVSFFKNGIHFGATTSYTAYSKDLAPNTSAAYRKYYPAGNNFWNISADYSYTGPVVTFNGETATGGCGAIATINTLSVTPAENVTLMALQRFFGKKYYSMHSSCMSEGGRVQNENGVFLGAQWRPTRKIKLTAYSDYAYFAAAKYQATVSSQAWDNLIQAQYTTDMLQITARYRIKMREYDNSEANALLAKTTQRVHTAASYNLGKWRAGATADIAYSHFESNSMGWTVGASAGYNAKKIKFSANATYFDTDDYESRIYAYEQSVLYSYAYQTFSGRGWRLAATARASIGQNVTLAAHLGTIHYLDRDTISSGMQQIDSPTKTDLQMQLKWKF